MKVKILRGTTLRGKPVNAGDIVDLDERDYNLFVKINKDAEPYRDEAKAPPVVESQPAEAMEIFEDKKGKKKL